MRTFKYFFIAGVVIALVGLWLLSQYGGMVALDAVAKRDWADFEAQILRRDNLIPDLVSAVKAYAPDEEDVFTAVADARDKPVQAATPEAKAEADAELTAGLDRLFAIADSHPELAADEAFFRLRKELADIERAIDDARRNYNEHVDLYNMCIDSFPASFLASAAGLTPRGRIELPSAPAGKPGTTAPSDQM